MKKLYSFFVDCGRMGSLEGLFISSEKELNVLNNSTIYFGEVLGKHSDVTIDDFKWKDYCTVVSDDQEKIEWLISLLGYTVSGFNPEDHFEIDGNSEYKEGYESTEEDECPYDDEESGEYLRWHFGLKEKLAKGEVNED